jgi:hypothetical protein
MYTDPGVEHDVLVEAHSRHDHEAHVVCMWQRAKYRGGFGYPLDPKPRRPRVVRVIDASGNISEELRP